MTIPVLSCLVYALYCVLDAQSNKYTSNSHVDHPRWWCLGCRFAKWTGL